jgi:hypothetical protein
MYYQGEALPPASNYMTLVFGFQVPSTITRYFWTQLSTSSVSLVSRETIKSQKNSTTFSLRTHHPCLWGYLPSSLRQANSSMSSFSVGMSYLIEDKVGGFCLKWKEQSESAKWMPFKRKLQELWARCPSKNVQVGDVKHLHTSTFLHRSKFSKVDLLLCYYPLISLLHLQSQKSWKFQIEDQEFYWDTI